MITLESDAKFLDFENKLLLKCAVFIYLPALETLYYTSMMGSLKEGTVLGLELGVFILVLALTVFPSLLLCPE